MIGFPVWMPSRKDASEILLGLQQEGYLRLVAGGETFHLSESDRSRLAKKVGRKGNEFIVIVDRVTSDAELSRLTESLETAMGEGNGRAVLLASVESKMPGKPIEIDGKGWVKRVVSESRPLRCM